MKMRIAVLDGCPFAGHPVFNKNAPTVYSLQKGEWHAVCSHDITEETSNPHGTAVCGIIAHQALPDVELLSFDVYDKSPEILTQKTLSALMHILEYEECIIVNMSMGIRTPNPDLENVCRKLSNKGVTIVAAFDNAGAISYPAAYPFVIGVDTSFRCTRADDFVYVEGSPVNIRAKGGIQRIPWVNPLYTINQGSSFAAPYVTVYMARLFCQGLSKQEALQYIKEGARYVYPALDTDFLPQLFSIVKAAIFPYNKEMQSLISFREHLNFDIHTICDIKYSGHMGLSVKGLFETQRAYTVQSISDLDWQAIDTMIIGHTSEMEGSSGHSLKKELLQQCLQQGKNVYSFDNESCDDFYKIFEEAGLSLYCPSKVNRSVVNHFGKLCLLRTPVLGIFGTTKRQGKFTLQLQLRYRLQQLGYSVGQLGTEPTSPLFGMDEVYPFGYNGISEDNLSRRIEEINWMMHKIDEKQTDIIVVGCQSGVIPMAYYNIGQIPLHQMAFLIATKPDAIILCVNIDDPILYIARTITAVEGLASCKVIALAIYPLAYENGWGIIRDKKKIVSEEVISKRKQELEKQFRIPVGVTGRNEDINIFISACLNFFGGGNESGQV